MMVRPHQALQVPEILSIILENFYHKGNIHSAQLAAVARTCKVFSGPALSILWRCMIHSDSVARLFKVIPNFKYVDSRKLYDFHDAIEPAHWLRFESYAAFVRELSAEDFTDFDSSVFVLTACHFKGRPMLPSLITLTLQHVDTRSALPLLLSPTLRSISLNGGSSNPLHRGLIEIIVETAPLIEKLQLTGSIPRESYDTISNLRGLRVLIIQHTFYRVGVVPLDIIASFSSLVALDLYFETNLSSVSPTTLKFQHPCFESLRSLSLTTSSHLTNSVLTMFILIPLESISLYINFFDSKAVDAIATQWTVTTTSIAQWANTLQHLEIMDIVSNSCGTVRGLSHFEPLLACSHLRSLAVRDVVPSPVLSHDDIIRMATAWPQLRELHFCPAPIDNPPDVTITSLAFLAEKLPHLRELGLPVCFSTLPPTVVFPQRTGQRLLHLDIEQFFFGDTDPVHVADHLNSLFPWAEPILETFYPSHDPRDRLQAILQLCTIVDTRAGSRYRAQPELLLQ